MEDFILYWAHTGIFQSLYVNMYCFCGEIRKTNFFTVMERDGQASGRWVGSQASLAKEWRQATFRATPSHLHPTPWSSQRVWTPPLRLCVLQMPQDGLGPLERCLSALLPWPWKQWVRPHQVVLPWESICAPILLVELHPQHCLLTQG